MDDGSRRALVLVEGLDGDADNLSLDILRQERNPRPRGTRLSFKYVLNSSSDRRVVEFC